MFYKLVLTAAVSFFSALLLTACQPPALYNQTQGNVADVKEHIDAARQKSDDSAKKPPTLVVNQGTYVDQTQISLARQPNWLKNKLILRGDQLPFSYYSRNIVSGWSGGRILMHYQTGLKPDVITTINYSGSVKGALDLLAAKTGYAYTVDGNDIFWQAIVTKTYDIAFMPGSSDYLMGKTGGGTSAGSGGGTAGGTVQGFLDDSSNSQYSSLKATSLSVWKDLETGIKQLLSPDGKVTVSEATTSVTVRDKPSNIGLVSQYIANLNANLSKQVLVKVQVLDIELSSDFDYGIEWDVTKRALGANFQLKGNNSEPISIAPAGGDAINKLGTLPIPTGNRGGSSVTALIHALQQQGKVSIVNEPRVVCLNNQVSVIRIVNQEGYLASVSNQTSPGAPGVAGIVTSTATPGTLITGLTLYILPKILNNNVYLQVNADLSDSGGFSVVSTSTNENNVNAVSIQVPKVSQKQFNQRSVIASGETLILSGFRKIRNESAASQLYGSQALGGQAAKQANKETIVLITPIILRGNG